ncbi:MAG: peptide chain release factor 3 [Gemmatimonadota bacterium]|nr:peptide chain release factor 3 [Gemmatimonadota bacterium]
MIEMNDTRRETDEVGRRRTFAIISHPDAGKTTMTEKLLLYGGAIRLAGSVKARKAARHTTSDWMEVEKERGISVSSSVLQFDWEGRRLNLLDTPGHQDFSEDTYRTLTAADSAVMLLDNRRGVEERTRKLFDVCRLRRLPIFTFVNKCDRAGVDPLELVDGVEEELGIRCAPVTWPVLVGTEALGVYHRESGLVHRFVRTEDHGATAGPRAAWPLESEEAREAFPEASLERLREEIALLDALAPPPDEEAVLAEEATPVFFGSALLNFGVEPFLRYFLDHAPPPVPREAGETTVDPRDPTFRGFVFKIQANMDPKHRDRIAFVRVCSGRWVPGTVATNLRTGREHRLSSARRFLARDRETVEEAVAGDVVGILDRGNLRIGDTLSGNGGPAFEGVPRFSPERFARVHPGDAFGRKHLDRGLRELSEEGAVQVLFDRRSGRAPRPMVGVVGPLQLDVLLHRLKHEYGVEANLESLPYVAARWVVGEEEEILRLADSYQRALAYDHRDRPLLLFDTEYSLEKAEKEAGDVELYAVSP